MQMILEEVEKMIFPNFNSWIEAKIVLLSLILILSINFEFWPSLAQGRDMEGNGPVVYAKRDIKAGAILCVSDVDKNVIPQAKIPGKAVPSPLLVVGCRAKITIKKDQLIFSQDIDFEPTLSSAEREKSIRELKLAREKWHSQSDLNSYRLPSKRNVPQNRLSK
ncbi:MAG: hypothetical protein JNN26_16650 [Candidatus Obscuribacter sp.]|nr:hypothetical protein [Candidatus Obscuribacter sp.]